jgi:hypothetical protein
MTDRSDDLIQAVWFVQRVVWPTTWLIATTNCVRRSDNVIAARVDPRAAFKGFLGAARTVFVSPQDRFSFNTR